jgi:outer membrane protein
MLVAGEYVAVLRAQREVEVAESSLRSLQAHAYDVDMLFDHGQVPRNDLLAAQVALSDASQRMIQAANLLDTSRATYNRRLGRPLTAEVHLAELPEEVEARDVEILTARALRARPELARLTRQIETLRHQAGSLRAQGGPQVELMGQYAFQENRFQTPEGITSVGVGLHWNLFDAGRSCHEARAASAQAEALARLRADAESTIRLEVRRAWLDIQETERRVAVTREALQQAEENLRVARERYAAGAGTNTEVLDAETLRTRTYQNHYNATYEVALARLRLRHATGQLGQ